MIKLKLSFLSLILSFFVFSSPILAINQPNSGSYLFDWTNPDKIHDNFATPSSQTPDSTGFTLKAGFPHVKTIIPFSFTVSNLSIDFGTLSPSTFYTKSNTLTVSSGASNGYSVVAFQNHPLKLQTLTANIPDTDCNTSCDQSTADIWTKTDKYGFGYNMSGQDIPADFKNSTYFKQFSDHSNAETSQIIMSLNRSGQNRTATVTYKINISPTQPSGDYKNTITFIAIPSY